jgi:hypothetical protein
MAGTKMVFVVQLLVGFSATTDRERRTSRLAILRLMVQGAARLLSEWMNGLSQQSIAWLTRKLASKVKE